MTLRVVYVNEHQDRLLLVLQAKLQVRLVFVTLDTVDLLCLGFGLCIALPVLYPAEANSVPLGLVTTKSLPDIATGVEMKEKKIS